MKEHAPVRLWQWAGRVYHEALFQGSLSAAGSNRQRLIERLGNDSRYLSKQGRMVQILGSFYLLFMTFLPAATMAELSSGATLQWNLLVTTLAGTVHLFVQTGYLMILTLVATSEILAPSLYRWPESLPLSPRETGLLRVMALFREFLVPLCVIVVSYPVAAAISGGVLVALATLPMTILHAMSTVSVIVLASWGLRKALRSASGSSRRESTVRVLTMLGYGLGIILFLVVMQFGTNFIASLFDNPRWEATATTTALRTLSLLPLPTAVASLVSQLVARSASFPPAIPLWMPLTGSLLYGALTLFLLRQAGHLIGQKEGNPRQRSRPSTRAAGAAAPGVRTPASRRLTVRPARTAFRRQIFQTATRDTQVLISLLFPLVIPTAMLLGPSLSGLSQPLLVYAAPVAAAALGGWMLVYGLSRFQAGTGALEETLPLLERDRAFPRLALCAVVPSVGAVLAAVVLLPGDLRLQGIVLAAIPSVAVPVGFLVKTALFGSVRGTCRRIVVDEVSLNHRFLKWVATIVSEIAVTALLLLIWIVASRSAAVAPAVFLLAAVVFAGGIVRVAAGLLFPAGRGSRR